MSVSVTTLPAPRVIAVAGAKGGTGKSMIAANIGVFLATLGKRVALIDAAFGTATLHSFVGVNESRKTLADFFADESLGLKDVLCPTLVKDLVIVTGERDPAWASNPRLPQFDRLRHEIRCLDVDFVVIDVSPGTRETVLDLFLDQFPLR